MYSYAIGLDIGIASVGWATVALDEEEHPCGILGMGSRVFNKAEEDNGKSLAAARRAVRDARRTLRRRRHRGERIKRLFVNSGLLTKEELDALYTGKLEDIYELRVRALDEPLTPAEFARVLLHISKRRGFRSNRRNAADKEEGKILSAISKNSCLIMDSEGNGEYRTVGEMFLKDERFAARKRNEGKDYRGTVTRDMVEKEVHKIFDAQRSLGADFAEEALEKAYLEILLSQRSFEEGPGGESPYGGNQIEKMRGKCTFKQDQPRAAKATYSFEYFKLLEDINNIRLIVRDEARKLTDEQREAIKELAFRSDRLTFSDLRRELALEDGVLFNFVKYEAGKSVEECEQKKKFKHMQAYHEMRREFNKVSKGRFDELSHEQRNSIATILTLHKNDKGITSALEEDGFSETDIEAALSMKNFTGFGDICVEVCDELCPLLEKGLSYDDACNKAGLHEDPARYTPENITNPVVRRAVTQAIKVVKAIIHERGCDPVYINVETGREMAKTFEERQKIKEEQDNNQKENDKLRDRIRTEYGIQSPSNYDILKLRLYEEQGDICAYSLKTLSIERLFEPGYAEIDHIVPYSISFDDSYTNKVLVLTEENRNKGNRLPLEYLTGKRRDDFIVWTNNTVQNERKKQLLLKERVTEAEREAFKARNLQDTKYASRFMLNYLNENIGFAPSACGRKERVTAVNGHITYYMRKRWGINKKREDGDRHHAVDALVIACTTESMIQQISDYKKKRELNVKVAPPRFPRPWPDFDIELDARLASDPQRIIRDYLSENKLPFYRDSVLMSSVNPIFVSRMPQRKVTGPAHEDTIRSKKAGDDYVVSKVPLTDLKLDKYGEIAGYYMPQSDRLLYEALKERLRQFDGKGKKAFAEPFHKPKRDGTPGPIVKKVQIIEKASLTVPVLQGTAVANHAKNSMVRIDVFKVDGEGYYFVPVYVDDTIGSELPKKACTRGKPYSEWKEMKNEDFIFSLYPNDLIKVTHKHVLRLSKVNKTSSLPPYLKSKSEFLYFKSAKISNATIKCINHDYSYEIQSLGIKTLKNIEKYTVDVLGNYRKVEGEKRLPFNLNRG